MSAYNQGLRAFKNHDREEGKPANPYADKKGQEWFAKQWELGFMAGHAEMVEANDNYNIEDR